MKIRWTVMLTLLLWGITISSVGAVTLYFDPGTLNPTVGEEFDVDVMVSGPELQDDYWTGGNDIGAFDFEVNFDDTVLSLVSHSYGTGLGWTIDTGSGDLGSGVVDFGQASMESDLSFQPDTFSLAVMRFAALTPGSSQVSLTNVALGDFDGIPLTLDPEQPIPMTLSILPGNTAVPEPGTLILFSLGVLWTALISRCEGAVK